MQNRHKKYLKAISLSIFFVAAVYIVALIVVIDEEKLNALTSVQWYLFALVVFFALASYLVRFIRWMVYVKPLQKDIGITKHFFIYFSAFALTTTPAKSGEMIRSIYLAPLGIPYGKSVAAFFSERVLDLVAILLLAYMVLIFSFDQYKSWLFLGGLFLLTLFYLLRSSVLSKMGAKVLKGRSKKMVLDFTDSVKDNFSNHTLAKAFPLSILAWSIQSFSLVIVAYAFGFEANMLLLMGIYCISILAGALSFIPGGVGVAEGAMSILLISIGMDPSLAIITSIIVRALTLWLAVGVGVVCMLILSKIF